MNGDPSYSSPSAFRQAVTDRLRSLENQGSWELSQLQRQLAYDRLLERLYVTNDGWVVKGATALLARDIGVRATRDIDLFRLERREFAEADLRTAAARDIGDWFRFELGAALALSDGARGIRMPVTAYVGTAIWAEFRIDLVVGDLRMTAKPDRVPPLAGLVMPDVEQHGYLAYPLVDHVADKVCATIESHGDGTRPSTRFKDLVDLVAIVAVARIESGAQMYALRSEAERRGLELPDAFDAPDADLWTRGYAAEARRSLLTTARTLEGALTVVRPFLNPLLTGEAQGSWDAGQQLWAR